jgi:transposase
VTVEEGLESFRPLDGLSGASTRRLLVEAAKHAWRRPRISDELRARQAGQDPRVVEVAWRAQRRLHRQWSKLAVERRKPTNVATVACARELTAFIWEAARIA